MLLRSFVVFSSLLFDDEERLAEFDGVAVLDEDADDAAGELGLDIYGMRPKLEQAGLRYLDSLDDLKKKR